MPGATLRIRASVAPMHAEASVSSPQISQRLAGHDVTVVATEGDWLRVRGEDGYEGWMHRGYLRGIGTRERESPGHRLLSLGCIVRDSRHGAVRALPLGAWLSPHEQVVTGEATDEGARQRDFPRDAAALVQTAITRFAGTPYQWGGVSPWGADCSGLVQTTFWLHGISLPRDAWQQGEVGTDADGLAKAAPADLLFFSERADRRITHVGIAIGQASMVHVALGRGGHAIDRLDTADDAYVTALVSRFVGARRVV